MTTIGGLNFVLVGRSGHVLTLALRRPVPNVFVIELTRDLVVVTSEQFTNGPDAVLRAITMRDEFIERGWTLAPEPAAAG